jgi:hypothetical protein
MVQRGGSLSFAFKTGQRMRVARNLIGQEFERNKTMKARVFRFVDHAHPAAADFLDNTVVRNSPPDHVKKILRRYDRQVNERHPIGL